MNRSNFFGLMGKAAAVAAVAAIPTTPAAASVVVDEELADIIRDMKREPGSDESFGATVRRIILEQAGVIPA